MGLWDVFKRRARATGPVELPPLVPPPAISDKARACAARVIDHVRLLHPEASKPVTVAIECRNDAIQIPSMEVPAVAGPSLPTCIVVDHALRTAFLASDIGHLVRSLGQSTSGWRRTTLTVDRDCVALLGATVPVQDRALNFGDAFMSHMRGADDAIAERQAALQQAMTDVGRCAVTWERNAGCLRLAPKDGAPVDIPADMLGSFSPDMQSWCWAWANRSIEQADAAAVMALRDRAAQLPGGALLTAGGCDCSEPLAFAIAYLAATHMGGRPVFRWPRPGGIQLFFAMAEPASWPAASAD